MPTFVKGNMWNIFGKTDIFFITTNPIRRNDGAVVMGRGIAKEFKDRYPRGAFDFGSVLGTEYRLGQTGDNCGLIGYYDNQPVGYFMVKNHWRDRARLDIIADSVSDLQEWVESQPLERVDLNFPGIGNGGLDKEEVIELLVELPRNVFIWEYL